VFNPRACALTLTVAASSALSSPKEKIEIAHSRRQSESEEKQKLPPFASSIAVIKHSSWLAKLQQVG
jgi:hypothetical protein